MASPTGAVNGGLPPILNEISYGVTLVAYGAGSLAVGSIIKARDLFTGTKETIPYITQDSGAFFLGAGVAALSEGCKKLAPAAGVLALSIATVGSIVYFYRHFHEMER